MTLAEIIASIQQWDEYRKKTDAPDALVPFFTQGIGFHCIYDGTYTSDMHVYPGIDANDNLVYLVIPACYDNQAYESQLAQNTQVCPLEPSLGNGQITPSEALLRIRNWQINYPTWVPAQVQTTYSIYQAMVIPAEDLQTEHYMCYLALKSSTGPTGYKADLIIDDGDSDTPAFYDTVRPVPPFKSTADRASFYLLTLAGCN